MSTEKWYFVDDGDICFSVVTTDDIVTCVPSVSEWMIGKHINAITRWVRSKNGKITEMTKQPEDKDGN